MKIIPKYQKGGSFDSLFAVYTPIQIQAPQQTTTTKQSTKQSSKSDNGELTEKDLYSMIKDIDGLPNDMDVIVERLLNTVQYENLTGLDTGSLATNYLQSLLQIKKASQNKKSYDDAMLNASKNGSLGEPAISMDGKLLIQNEDGSIGRISVETYNSNREEYSPKLLTVSSLADMRKFDPQLANNSSVFDIINNSMGYESFQGLLDKATSSLGSSMLSTSGMFSAEGEASKGLALLNNLRKDDRVRAQGSVTAEGLYQYNIIDKNQLQQIKSLTQYILSTFPDRAKTWAAVKTGDTNKNEATEKLVLSYLLSTSSDMHTFNIQYKGSMDKVTGNDKSDSNSSKKDPNMGFWSQAIAGIGGEYGSYNIVSKDVLASASGKYYGTTPGLDGYKSLNQYIIDSNVGYVIKNRNNITFGDNRIADGNDVIVDPNGGSYIVTLPITPDGQVNFSILDKYNKISDQVISKGYKLGTQEYNTAMAQELENNQMGYLVQGVSLNPNMFGHFLVLQGIGSSKTQVKHGSTKISLSDSDSNYVIDSSEDDNLYDILKQTLSTKDSDYNLDNNWLDFGPFSNDKVYRGNIFIPLTSNPTSAMNADDNNVNRSKAYEFEEDYQTSIRRNKLSSLNSTSSENL